MSLAAMAARGIDDRIRSTANRHFQLSGKGQHQPAMFLAGIQEDRVIVTGAMVTVGRAQSDY
jgi:hypothetical protein